MALDPDKLFGKDDPMKIYKLLEELAVGSYGRVYRVQDKKTNAVCALKVIPLEENDSLDVRHASPRACVQSSCCIGLFARDRHHEEHYASQPRQVPRRLDEEARAICTHSFHTSRPAPASSDVLTDRDGAVRGRRRQ